MKPIFEISCDDPFLQGQIDDRLIEARFLDRPGLISDTLEIQLDDRDGKTLNPEHGQTLKLLIGYEETALSERGAYIIDRTEFKGPPDTMTIFASALNFRDAMASEKSRRWDQTTLGNVVRSIASEHGYTPVIDTTFESIAIEYLLQRNESDIRFLSDLADRYGALFKALGQAIVFIARGSNRNALIKQQLGSTTLNKNQVTTYKVGREDTSRYTGVKANWNDFQTASGNTESVIAGNEDKIYILKETYGNAEQAQAAAQAKLDVLIRKSADVSITLPGHPNLTCEGELILEGFRDRVDDTYVITEVKHSLNKMNGYQSHVKAELAS